jgi:hypothetical protein
MTFAPNANSAMPPNMPAAAGPDAIKKTLGGMSAEMKPAGLTL